MHRGPTRQAAVLGHPIEHSLSPVLHRAAYAALDLDWAYTAIDCDAAGLPAVLDARPDWAGFSCTMPLKRAALQLAATSSDLARAVGAANTLLPGPGGWAADNTDVQGIVGALDEFAVTARTVSILGAGGSAQAAVAALRARAPSQCRVYVRDSARAAPLLATAERLGIDVVLRSLSDADEALDADLVVSTLPAGAADGLSARTWRAGQTLLDVVYADWPTPLAAGAQRCGAQTVSGALMLLHQAAAQVELMTGVAAPVSAMRAALARVVPGSGL